jgi:spore coat protein U-like protein
VIGKGIFTALVAAGVLAAAGAAPSQVPKDNECGVASTPLSFGRYSVFNPQGLDSTAEVRIACNGNRTIRIGLSQGLYGTYFERAMARVGGTERLRYQIYTDGTRQVPWGNGTSGTQLVTGLVHTGRVVFVMYAHVPGSQFVPAGTYTDQLIVNIAF